MCVVKLRCVCPRDIQQLSEVSGVCLLYGYVFPRGIMKLNRPRTEVSRTRADSHIQTPRPAHAHTRARTAQTATQAHTHTHTYTHRVVPSSEWKFWAKRKPPPPSSDDGGARGSHGSEASTGAFVDTDHMLLASKANITHEPLADASKVELISRQTPPVADKSLEAFVTAREGLVPPDMGDTDAIPVPTTSSARSGVAVEAVHTPPSGDNPDTGTVRETEGGGHTVV